MRAESVELSRVGRRRRRKKHHRLPPLIEPDRRISRIRLSEVVHRVAIETIGSSLCGRVSVAAHERYPAFLSPRTEPSPRPLLLWLHVDQVWPLRSRSVTSVHHYYRPLRLLRQPRGPHGFAACARCRALSPAAADLILYPNLSSEHSVPANPAVAMTGQTVVQASPASRRVCLGPVPWAFALPAGARLHRA